MRYLCTALCSLLLTVPNGAYASQTAVALNSVNGAIDQVRDDSDGCRKGVLKGLKDARDKLEIAGKNATRLVFTKARRAVEDAYDDGGSQCAQLTQKAIKHALESIKKGLGAATAAASAPSPAELKRQCWNYRNDWSAVDPGCSKKKDGVLPLNKTSFDSLSKKIRAARHAEDKLRIAEESIDASEKRWITSLQLASLAKILPSDADRLELVRLIGDCLVDPDDSGVVARYFRDRMLGKQALDVLRGDDL